LTSTTTKRILDAFSKGEKPKPGPQSGRHTSENSAGPTSLTSKVGSLLTACCLVLIHHPFVALWSWRILFTRIPVKVEDKCYVFNWNLYRDRRHKVSLEKSRYFGLVHVLLMLSHPLHHRRVHVLPHHLPAVY